MKTCVICGDPLKKRVKYCGDCKEKYPYKAGGAPFNREIVALGIKPAKEIKRVKILSPEEILKGFQNG